MKSIKTTLFSSLILSLAFFVLFLSSCRKKSMDGMIIFTQVTDKIGDINYINGDSWRYLPHAQIAAIDPDKPEKSLNILTEQYYSARSPEISYDGKHLLFAAQKNQNDPWQIWEMNLGNLKTIQVTSSSENCIDPAYLPGGRIIFCKSLVNDSLKAGHSLFTCNPDGTDMKRITFNPHAYFAPSVLEDGRVITISRQLYPIHGEPAIMILRPDGTKSELFYEGLAGSELFSRGYETAGGQIVFIESGKEDQRKNISSISYNRPLHTRINLTASIKGGFYSVFPLQSGILMVSYRSSDSERYALFEFDPDKKAVGKTLYKSPDYDILEAVVVGEHQRPKKLPSEVDMGVKTGLLLCQNINVTDIQSTENKFSFSKADRIEIVGIDSSLGIVKVEKDGSFFLKVAADIPFSLKTMDADGRVINGPGSWIWLRPNERRGCVGCHEDRERVPANRLSLAVKNQPVGVPVHVSTVKQKDVELE
jgi:hypothetical protein